VKKPHGPAFRAAQLDLAKCPACRGRAVINGVFHELACVQCNASGWVTAETGESLPLDVLVTQLSIRSRPQIINLRNFASWPRPGLPHNTNRTTAAAPAAPTTQGIEPCYV